MATKKRLDLVEREAVKDAIGFMNLHFLGHGENKSVLDSINEVPSVDAVILPYEPRPMLKDRNPHNTDVYCPECGTNLSGYYGDEPLPIVTCFNCGEILDPYKATTGTNGERKYNDNK